MCGILALVRLGGHAAASTGSLQTATRLVRHRGPDDEGFLLWEPGGQVRIHAGRETASATRERLALEELPEVAPWRVAFGHRRLSIVDLSPAGHQPMVHAPTGIALTYNGEIYNHVELRRDLEREGHRFQSHGDTEVLLAAWAAWGPACLARLNGMFSFVVLDPRDGSVHAVRDRFGVKPLYWARAGEVLGFASEIKQLRALPGFDGRLDQPLVQEYLASGLLDHTAGTLHQDVRQLRGGEHLSLRVQAPTESLQIRRWYTLQPRSFAGSFEEGAGEFRRLLEDSVRLRLRADVPVGSCLSGGLDSSAIVCLAARVLATERSHAGQVTVTARYENARYDEWRFAEEVVARSGATPVVTWPSVERLREDLDAQLWFMDEPFGSTSQFSQWCVFAAAADAGLKVMLDGQGADEQLAGYPGADAALYRGLLTRGAVTALSGEAFAFRRRHGAWPIAQLLLAARSAVPGLDAVLPPRLRATGAPAPWVRGFDGGPGRLAGDLEALLREQTLASSLPVLLRYEDRNSMAWSIESRVPFLDYRLVEFLAGLPAEWKLRRGQTKRIMREALRGVLPEPVRDRRDKMGFVTPEQVWLQQSSTTWFREELEAALDVVPDLLDPDATRRMFEEIVDGRAEFTFAPWRVLCLGRWLRRQDDAAARATTPADGIRGSIVA